MQKSANFVNLHFLGKDCLEKNQMDNNDKTQITPGGAAATAVADRPAVNADGMVTVPGAPGP